MLTVRVVFAPPAAAWIRCSGMVGCLYSLVLLLTRTATKIITPINIAFIGNPGIPPLSSTVKVTSVLDEPMWVSSPIHVLLTFHFPKSFGVMLSVYVTSEAGDEIR